MPGDGNGAGRRRLRRVVAAVGGGLALLTTVTSCGSMPDHGDIRAVDAPQGVDSQVRVFGAPPPENAGPQDIVDGFLEAMTSDDPELATARKYLTKGAAEKWRPQAGITVLSAGVDRSPAHTGEKDRDAGERYRIHGRRLASVDDRSAYRPDIGGAGYEEFLHLVKVDDQWRIDSLPNGLVLSEPDFQRIYRSVNKYYFAPNGTLVADPVYVRQRSDPDSRMDPMTQAVASLLAGPSTWLGPVVTTAFPTGTVLPENTRSLSYDGQNTLRVPLGRKAANVGYPQCQKMAAQVLYTARDVTATRFAKVELLREDGKSSLCAIDEVTAASLTHRVPAVAPSSPYYVDKDHRLVRMRLRADGEDTESDVEPVQGPLSASGFKSRSAAVSYDERRAAVVSEDGRTLHVAPLTGSGPPPPALVTSKTGQLSAPSWDADGDVWVADQDPAAPALWRIPQGSGQASKVEVAGLDGGVIESVRVSYDGVRVALLVVKGNRKNLFIGRIEQPVGAVSSSPSGPAGTPRPALGVSVRELRPAAPQMADVTAMSWAPRGRLLVVGRESGGVVQARYMQGDGSPATGSLPGASGLLAVAASEDEKQPVVAFLEEDGIVWLPPGAQWRMVDAGGRAPVYPG
ncbi:LpqB family beta-propeller domain-containing protein [Streptomyces sp. BI20]|uniref:LpqB family beta-propeller domain-containing protein n=1 Tax=Streptomyces sp. BI20 TaxID=3403460 RepID=UPI003C790797